MKTLTAGPWAGAAECGHFSPHPCESLLGSPVPVPVWGYPWESLFGSPVQSLLGSPVCRVSREEALPPARPRPRPRPCPDPGDGGGAGAGVPPAAAAGAGSVSAAGRGAGVPLEDPSRVPPGVPSRGSFPGFLLGGPSRGRDLKAKSGGRTAPANSPPCPLPLQALGMGAYRRLLGRKVLVFCFSFPLLTIPSFFNILTSCRCPSHGHTYSQGKT